MLSSLLLVALLADPAPPVVGRPIDYSGAVGGPFTVTLAADPTVLAPEEPLTLSLRITGSGNLADVRRPDLDALKTSFAVEPLDEAVVPGGRVFRYRLRPRTAAVTEVPGYKFIYFNPRLPPALGYQTTYAQPVPLTVTANPVRRPDEHFDVPPPGEPADNLLAAVVVALALPPLGCLAWYAAWRRAHPDAARRAAQARSRAAADALRALRRPDVNIGVVITDYLNRRFDGGRADHGELSAETAHLLHRWDAARFAPTRPAPPAAAEAERLVLAWEAAP
jgi:hypothetical protein